MFGDLDRHRTLLGLCCSFGITLAAFGLTGNNGLQPPLLSGQQHPVKPDYLCSGDSTPFRAL